MTRSLLLPVETLNREFDAKLLLALYAAARGWEVVLGQKTALHRRMARFPRSVYVAKGFRWGREREFREIGALGHTIVGMDEEGLVNVSDEMWLSRSDSPTLRHLALIVAWGPDDARLYRRATHLGDTPVVETGNARVDLLRPELEGFLAPEAARLRERYGDFALVNTNFALVNRYVELNAPVQMGNWLPQEVAEGLKSNWIGHKKALLEAFLALLPRLAGRLGPRTLVIRPHPSENAELWREAAEGLGNVRVVHEGTVAPWLLAAKVLIHNGCTTAVEAAVLGTPALAYRPVTRVGFDNDLPNGLSEEFADGDALADRAAELTRQPVQGRVALSPERRALLERHLTALDGPLACDRLIDALEDRIGPPAPVEPLRYAVARGHIVRRRVRRALRTTSKWAGRKSALLGHQFPHVPLGEVEARLGRLDAALGGIAEVSAEELAPNLFRVRSSGSPARSSRAEARPG
ncbi:MAG TPA: surface carbohydrate biosynthesis protein [Thermohalobaculum sp.]|nr:surface carbohydrate biosynthesis protein [Thermohalobaculum sp.]